MIKSVMAVLSGVSMLTLAACQQSGSTTNETTNATTTTTRASSTDGTIDGTWKGDVSSVKFEQKPDEYLLQNGRFDCKSCIPPVSIAADGAYQPVTNHAYYDEESIKVVDDKTVQQSTKLKGRETGHATMAVSPDGKTLTINWTDTSVANAKANTGSFVENRVASGPARSHALSGSWTPAKIAAVNQEAITLNLKTDADMLHMSSPTGVSYDAKLDGSPTPIKGDPAGATASVKKLSDNSYQETDSAGGKVVNVTTFTLSSDGKLILVSVDPRNGSKTTWTANRS
ncbi:hypothetical protein [Sphingomonas sp.]|uniref:hypothetical protein n=1 Tax=Sphingomonas sp. TaxID=28214 RepID=UPI0038A16B3F